MRFDCLRQLSERHKHIATSALHPAVVRINGNRPPEILVATEEVEKEIGSNVATRKIPIDEIGRERDGPVRVSFRLTQPRRIASCSKEHLGHSEARVSGRIIRIEPVRFAKGHYGVAEAVVSGTVIKLHSQQILVICVRSEEHTSELQ